MGSSAPACARSEAHVVTLIFGLVAQILYAVFGLVHGILGIVH